MLNLQTKYKFFLISFLLFFLISFTLFADDSKKIKIIGNENVDDEVILSIIQDHLIDYSDENLNKIIKSLYSTGNFNNIEIEYDNETIILKITENPTIQNLNFIGNKRFKDEEILEIFNQGDYFLIYNDLQIQKFIKDLSELYMSFGYNLINIKYDKKINESNNNFVDLNFEISEGKVSKINKIFFSGNNQYSSFKLRSLMKSKQANLLRYFNTNFKKIQIRKDQEKIINFYKKNGYKDIQVSHQTEFILNKNRFNVYFDIIEGSKYNFNEININLISLNIDEKFKEELLLINNEYFNKKIQKNNTYNEEELENLKDQLSEYLYDSGIVFFDIETLQKVQDYKVDIILKFFDKSPMYVNQINIIGNTRTKDRVIRREIPFVEGDAVNKNLIRKTYKNINRLNFFNKVELKEKPNDELVDIEIEVEESSTGQFNFGIAFDSYRGPTFISSLQEKNIMGDGRNLDFSLNTSENNKQLKLGILEPYIFNEDIDLIYDISYQQKDYTKSSSYKLDEFNTGLGFRYSLTNEIKHSLKIEYILKDYSITNSSNVSSNIEKQSGTNADVLLINGLVYDDLDSIIRPSEGDYLRFDNILSPATNDDNGYFKNILTHKKYIRSNLNVFSIQNRIGNIFSLQNKEIPSDDKFSLGGRWLRGFDSYGVGPRESRTAYIGGNNLIVTKLDYQRPILDNSDNPVDLNVFMDAGSVFDNKNKPTYSDNSIRASYGYGFKFYSPIGPVGFSWAFPISDENYDIKRMFSFTIGNLN